MTLTTDYQIIMEIQITRTMKYHIIPVGMIICVIYTYKLETIIKLGCNVK